MAAVDSFGLLYRQIARSCDPYFETLALVGALYTVNKVVVLLRDCCTLIRVHFIPRVIPNKSLTRRFGEWAVIYGGCDVIGRAYAEELAQHGVSILLVGSDAPSLSEAVATLSQSYGVEVAIVITDFSVGGAACKPVQDALRGRDIGFLVTCLDTKVPRPLSLVGMSEDALCEGLSRSVTAATLMTGLVLPGMLQRRRGAVVNIGSGACWGLSGGRVVLTASTAYLDSLSRALHQEYGHQGVFIQSLLPLGVRSRDERCPAASWFYPEARVYARHAISTLGTTHRTTGYWPHTLQAGLMRCVPDWMLMLGSHLCLGGS